MKEDALKIAYFSYASIQNLKKHTRGGNINYYKEYILHLKFH